MIWEKLLTTLWWSAICTASAMLADFLLTVVILKDDGAYTPLVTLAIATVVTIPTCYILVSSRLNLQKTRDALALARDAAVQADRTKTRFFANMSHELRTPLNAILGFSELLALDVFAPKREEYAHLIHNAGAHLLSLVNDLLDLQRIEAGKLELNLEPLDLAVLIADCVETVATRARSRDIKLVRTLDPRLPLLTADQRAIKQILLNLLTNAIKFGNTGGTVEVFAGLLPSGELAFGVSDDGIGIPESELAHVFERFGQARQQTTSSEKGTGLGLPIVKGLVEAHGGHIAMQSRVKEGTRVTVTFPAGRIERSLSIALAS